MVFAGSSPITTTSPSSKAHQKSGPFPQPALPGFDGHTTPSDSRHGRRLRDVEAATLALDGSPPITRNTFPTCRAHYPGGSSGCTCRLLPHSYSLPQMAGGSASALSLSRPAQASHMLRPTGSLSRPRRPLSRGSSPSGHPAEPLVSYQINRQLSGWILPPQVIRAFGAHCQIRTSALPEGWPEVLLLIGSCRNVSSAGAAPSLSVKYW
jgi:hypothetical protein